MTHNMQLTQRQIKWGLFTAFVLFVPCLYYLFVIGGFLPLAFILLISFSNPGVLLVNLIHVVIYGLGFYGIAAYATKLLYCVNSVPIRLVILMSTAAGLGMIAMAPSYGAAHNSIEWKNWLGIMRDIPMWW